MVDIKGGSVEIQALDVVEITLIPSTVGVRSEMGTHPCEDGIHRPGVAADVRRFVLAVLFSLAAGVGAGARAQVIQASTGMGVPAVAASFALPPAVVFVLTAAVMLRLEKSLSPTGLRAVRQLLSLACAGAGLLVLFPCWMEHFVEPHESDEPRISISFNVVTA